MDSIIGAAAGGSFGALAGQFLGWLRAGVWAVLTIVMVMVGYMYWFGKGSYQIFFPVLLGLVIVLSADWLVARLDGNFVDEDLAQDTLFLALMRPAMMWVLPLDAALMIAVAATALLLGLGNPIIALGVGAASGFTGWLWFAATTINSGSSRCGAAPR